MKVFLLVLFLTSINTSISPIPDKKSNITLQKFIEPSPGCFNVYFNIGQAFDFPSNFKRQSFMKVFFIGDAPEQSRCNLLNDTKLVKCCLNNVSQKKFSANFSYSYNNVSDSFVLDIDRQNLSALKTSLIETSQVPQTFGLAKRIRGISAKNIVLTFVTQQPFASSANYSQYMRLKYFQAYYDYEIMAFATSKQKLAYRIDLYFPNFIPKKNFLVQFRYGTLKKTMEYLENIDPRSIVFVK